MNFLLVLKGMAMGVAETIPGVSGGTIAFITGIYETLLQTVKAFNPELINCLKTEGLKAAWKKINGTFLVSLLAGMLVGIGIGVVVISQLLELYPPAVWAFFFGLIIASIIYIGKQISIWNLKTILALVCGAVFAFGITQLPVGQVNESLWFVFLCGVIAVSALILPGISGSFILLIMGMYGYILHDTLKEGLFKNHDPLALLTLAIFGLGMLLGLATMSRFLTWSLKHHKNITFALLTGFMVGALNKLWPWRIPLKVMDMKDQIVEYTFGMIKDENYSKIISEYSTTPSQFTEASGSPALLPAVVICFALGVFLVLGMDKFSSQKSTTHLKN
ncbi:MAG: DUF368 domain-containing protein [Flavobacteriales bacterium]